MIVGFLGKGGSGKSSVSSQATFFLNQNNKSVLAIDADHNMDLSFNLTGDAMIESLNYLGTALGDLQNTVGLQLDENYSEVFLKDSSMRFSFSKDSIDPFTKKYSQQLSSGLRLMSAGPQTDQVLFGQSCGHILTTPLKIYLPLLDVGQDEYVVVDEKAGADGVTTGIVTGIDVGVIVCEPALHSVKTGQQIAELMNFYDTPYVFVGNKITSSEDKDFIISELKEEPVAFLMESVSVKRNPNILVSEWSDELKEIFDKAKELNKNDRLDRTINKFQRNREFGRT